MARSRKNLERGLLAGAALGALYVATRPRGESGQTSSKLVDWRRVEESALGMVRRLPEGEIENRLYWNQRYRGMVRRSIDVITEYTGIGLNQPLDSVYVFDRQDWVRANLEGFRRVFDRIEEIQKQLKPGETFASLLLGEANRQVLSAQLGLLMGYLARRVLGQYDLSLLGKEAVTSGNLYFVEPNIARLERELKLPAEDLRMWIALHETTHAFEFEGNPWLRQHFNGILEGYFEGLNDQVRGLRGAGAVAKLAARLREGGKREAWVELLMSDEQRKLFRQMQGIMSLLEGYSNHIMNTVGATILPEFEQIKERIEARQKRNRWADKMFARMTGLNVKLEQYRLGEIFVNEVVNRKGIDFMNRVWSAPEALPTMEEIRQPDLWVRRQEAAAA
jgi:coenzyme F420 biosynthesis associated uncharacterized protein